MNASTTKDIADLGIIDQEVRKLDEEKIKDYKDDIDTLLVFAGLYSAVLTAFLIESYKNLEEDPQQVVIGLLRQITAQTENQSLSPGNLNSTAPSLATSSFAPHTSDIRVNVCWFASLVFSLSTASFGILVKGWLKEYLAMYHMTHDVRLRIRHFRYTGLEDWKLFEIAAILPLILQLSLALFFVGLCFFTASVHPSIGMTCRVLVSGWAAFFVFALIAPILSSRCPYKTTLLKTPLSFLRLNALPTIVYSLYLIIYSLCFMGYSIVISFGVLPFLWLSTVGLAHIFPWPEKIKFPVSLVRFREFKEALSNPDAEESQICRTNSNDISMLATVDSLLLNEEHFPTMQAALYKTQATSTLEGRRGSRVGLNLALEVTRRRLGLKEVYKVYFSWDELLPMHHLPDVTQKALLEMVADEFQYLQKIPDKLNSEKLVWMEETCWFMTPAMISFGLQGQPYQLALPNRVVSVIDRVLDSVSSDKAFMAGRIRWTQESGHEPKLSQVLSNTITTIRALDIRFLRDPLVVFFQCYFWKTDRENAIRIPGSILVERLQWVDLASRDISCQSLVALVELALTVVDAADDQRRDTRQRLTLPAHEMELIEFVLDAIPLILGTPLEHMKSLSSAKSPYLVFQWLFNSAYTLPQFLDCILARSQLLSTGKYAKILLHAFDYAKYPFRLPPWKEYIRAKRYSGTILPLVSTLHLCRMVCYPEVWDYRGPNVFQYWHTICNDLVALMKNSKPSDHIKESLIARAILQDLDSRQDNIKLHRERKESSSATELDRLLQKESEQYAQWRHLFNPNASRYTDDLIRRLRDIAGSTVDKDGFTFWRIRLLNDENRPQSAPPLDPIEEAQHPGPLQQNAMPTELCMFVAPSTSGSSIIVSDPARFIADEGLSVSANSPDVASAELAPRVEPGVSSESMETEEGPAAEGLLNDDRVHGAT